MLLVPFAEILAVVEKSNAENLMTIDEAVKRKKKADQEAKNRAAKAKKKGKK